MYNIISEPNRVLPFNSRSVLSRTGMQDLKAHVLSVRNAKHDHHIYTIGAFAAVCVGADLLVSFLGQLSEVQQQNGIFFVVLSVIAFFAGSVNAGREKTDTRNAKGAPMTKRIQIQKGEYENRKAGSQPARRSNKSIQARVTTPVAQPEEYREASQAAQTADPQPELSQKQLKAPRFVSRSSAGTHIPTEGEDATNKSFDMKKLELSEIDARAIEDARLEAMELSASVHSESMIACIRSNDGDMALKLFDLILEKDVNCNDKPMAVPTDTAVPRTTDQRTRGTSGHGDMPVPADQRYQQKRDQLRRFFSLVAGRLDDERLRNEGLQILAAVRAHGVEPPHILQNRLIRAWGSKLPEQVLKYFTKMREDGVTLSSAVCRCMMADVVDSTGEGGKTRPPLVDGTISQNIPTCDDEGAGVLQTTAERRPLRSEASTFVPTSWEGPWQMPSEKSMPCNWVPYPPGLWELPQTAMQHMRSQSDGTTVILRNLPCHFLREDLIKEIDAKGFAGSYNLIYMPIDWSTEMSMGYAFANLVTAEKAQRLMDAFTGFRDWPSSCSASSKVCVADLARTQGLAANVARYRNSPGMGDGVPERFRPVLFNGTVRIPFPEPTRAAQW